MDSYYVVSSESRKVLFGPFTDRKEADAKHYEICSKGIPVGDGEVKRPRVAVVIDHALTPNEQGNHYSHAAPPEEPSKEKK